MDRYRVSGFRIFIAAAFLFEIGSYFGWDHIHDSTPAEVIATGIAFLLVSIAVERSK